MTGALRGAWEALGANREELTVLASFVGIIVASIVATAALMQARTARRRHEEETKADLQRRITENYTKAVEQLGSDKPQVRLGGIYTLERISQESSRDYWTVMETLAAFVREQARWEEPDDTDLSRTEARVHADAPRRRSKFGPPLGEPPTDIQAVLSVVMSRSKANRKREKREGWRLDFGATDLRGADLRGAHLERAFLTEAHLEGAFLAGAHFQGAELVGAHLQGAILRKAHFQGAELDMARLQRAKLEEAKGLRQEQLESAYGDAKTTLPTGLTRPADWTEEEQEEEKQERVESQP